MKRDSDFERLQKEYRRRHGIRPKGQELPHEARYQKRVAEVRKFISHYAKAASPDRVNLLFDGLIQKMGGFDNCVEYIYRHLLEANNRDGVRMAMAFMRHFELERILKWMTLEERVQGLSVHDLQDMARRKRRPAQQKSSSDSAPPSEKTDEA